MNPAFDTIISADSADLRETFLQTATRLGANAQHIEKDFWVCWTLDHLFNGRKEGSPRLLFKGGTSLSKAFGLIRRFSEDIDVTVFRPDLDHAVSVADLKAMSGKKRDKELDQIKVDCGAYIRGPLKDQLSGMIAETMGRNKLAGDPWKLEVAPDDADQQSLLFWYPSVFGSSSADNYVRRAVLIESGAKSALDPHVTTSIKPYIADDLAGSEFADFSISGITTADPMRTFWDKVVVAHGQHQWFAVRGEMKGGGERLTRHYYDLHQLLNSEVGQAALEDFDLGQDVVEHASMFFNRKQFNLGLATPGSFTLAPAPGMIDGLRADYANMAGMIFGGAPEFDAVMASIEEIEARLNAGPAPRL